MKADRVVRSSWVALPHLVAGDGDLLAMSPFHGIPIITPARFLALHGKTGVAATGPAERDTAT